MRTPTLVGLLLAASAVSAQGEPRFGVVERSFTQSTAAANPYVSIRAAVTLEPPDGETRTIPLFWDGGSTWRFRFSPDTTGTWTWSIASNDTGLDGKSGSFDCVPSSNRGGIRARASHPYHFEYENGTPFWWFGDTMWRVGTTDISENLDRSTLFAYVDLRASQGFNYIHANMGASNASNDGGMIWNGATGKKIRPSYFQEVDKRVQYLDSKGITLGYMLAWAQGWDDYPEEERLRYARYVVARYSAYNVVFIVAGEYDETLLADD